MHTTAVPKQRQSAVIAGHHDDDSDGVMMMTRMGPSSWEHALAVPQCPKAAAGCQPASERALALPADPHTRTHTHTPVRILWYCRSPQLVLESLSLGGAL